MPYVERNVNAAIVGRYTVPQRGRAEEFLSDDHPDIVALVATEEAERQLEEDVESDADRVDLASRLTGASPDQIKTYVQNNVTDLASAKVLLTKIILVLAGR